MYGLVGWLVGWMDVCVLQVEAAHPIPGYVRTPVCFPDRDTDVHHVLYSLRIPIVHPLHLIHDLYNDIIIIILGFLLQRRWSNLGGADR